MVTDLVLFEETEFLALFGLGTLFVIAPLDGIAHGRHGGRICDVYSGRKNGISQMKRFWYQLTHFCDLCKGGRPKSGGVGEDVQNVEREG